MLGRFSRILLVDDSAVQRRVVRGLLGTLGFENIDEAASGRDALKILGAHSYRLVISDWQMAPLDGSQLLGAMRRDDRLKRVPVILMTSQAQKKFFEIARDSGITLFLAKPFTADDLAERIGRIANPAAA